MNETEEQKTGKKVPVKTLIITLLVFIGVSLFVWRIYYYMDLIRTGQLADMKAAEAQEMSVSRLAAAAAVSAGSETEVSTADQPSIGSPVAPLTIVMFGDFACPYSREAAQTVRALAYQYYDTVRFVYKDFPLTDLHPDAEQAAEAAACAGDQDRYWDMFDRLYLNQSDLSRDALVDYANTLNLEMNRFQNCLNSGIHEADVVADYAEGLILGVYGTPTFFFNGEMIQGSIPGEFLRALVQEIQASQ
jgi:protein-disulfide isomerase